MDLTKYFEEHAGFGVLSTADQDGRVNAAVYARPHCFPDGTVGFIMSERLTHSNLQSNDSAAYLFRQDTDAGDRRHEGVRLYLRKIGERDDQEEIAKLRRRARGYGSGRRHMVIFEVAQQLPLVGAG